MDLLEHLCTLFGEKGKIYEQLGDIEWKQGKMFFTDVTYHLHALNLSLRDKDKIMCDLTPAILSFQNKIKLFQTDIDKTSPQHFPLLKGLVYSENDLCSEKTKVYVKSFDGASTNFATRITDLEDPNTTFSSLANPFVDDVVKDGCNVQKPTVSQSANVKAELLGLQQDLAPKTMHQSQSTVEFWKQVSVDKYPALRQTSQRPLIIFWTTYC